jgi:hypothetical protein
MGDDGQGSGGNAQRAPTNPRDSEYAAKCLGFKERVCAASTRKAGDPVGVLSLVSLQGLVIIGWRGSLLNYQYDTVAIMRSVYVPALLISP